MKLFRCRCRKSSPSTPEVLSTSPETPTKDNPNFGRPRFVAAGLPSDIAASASAVTSAATTTTVRENPMHGLPVLYPGEAPPGISFPENLSRNNTSVGMHNSASLDHPSPDDDDVIGAAGVDWDRMVKLRLPHRVTTHCSSNQNLAPWRQGGHLTGQGAVRGCTKMHNLSSSVPSRVAFLHGSRFPL